MKRVLFDHNVPEDLRHFCRNHSVTTAHEAGWAGLSNGDLLKAAETNEFEVLLTADQNLVYQQNLSSRVIAIVVLGTNHWPTLKSNPEKVVAAIDDATPQSFQRVEFTMFHRPRSTREPKR